MRIEAIDVRKSFGDRLVLSIDRLRVYDRETLGVVGPNGAGKSTLFNILSGELPPDEGVVHRWGSLGYCKQIPNSSGHLSGGEATKARLEKVLREVPQILLLDEPTASLDLEGVMALEKRLSTYPGAILLVSHDRQFLDTLCTKILEVEGGGVREYSGNYSHYVNQKEEETRRAQAVYEQVSSEKKRLEAAVLGKREQAKKVRKTPPRMGNSEARLHKRSSNTAKAKLEKQAKALQTRIEHLPQVHKPRKGPPVQIDLKGEKLHNPYIIQAREIQKEYPGKQLFHKASFSVQTGSRVAVLGPNGSGKTTLVQMILSGETGIQLAHGTQIGYFRQDLSLLDPEKTVLENMPTGDPTKTRLILARMLFSREDVHKKVDLLSGGEKVRASLARLVLQPTHLLILDEPTNYLDIPALEALAQVLQEYQGTLLFTSHDRRFVDQVATDLLVIEDRQITSFSGNFSQWQEAKQKKEPCDDLLVLEHRLAEITSRLSMPAPGDDVNALDREFRQLLTRVRQAKQRQ